ncbi:CDC42 small effector protein 2-like isoform X2 [Antedon mediterranea]|uniref:CDC42 small effector protein 2-like isoform X2 n=1 Tax=Antedon mediterranea TaxID=105859 RepID=UPI003AF7E9A3
MGDLWICFGCCVAQQPPSSKRRRHIDRSMIGLPTDFRHTGHIGSGEMSTSGNQGLNALQTQMSSKGGYEYNMPVAVEIRGVEIAVGGGDQN